nr:receptor-type guanylate cyclase gcy-19-like [Procambarus clarkii]
MAWRFPPNSCLNYPIYQEDYSASTLPLIYLPQGMIYLHDSEIVSHGNLRSTNCLIDSRWILQVADFGLHEFKASPYQMGEPHKKLWRAPELLRAPGAHPRGTQKGDVFSFGIILFEVVGRQGPWGALTHKFSLQEIVCQVTEGQEPPLRPPLGSLKTPEYVQRCLMECWAEDPDERPDFKLVRVRLKEMQSGLKLNIVDNMLAMMEKYAYNLEGKVQERTKQLMEEKKKTETLLLRMLPKSVAESLKRGEQVSPESYDNVTIYFSDIVGFTSLSAESAPLQMVNMLNELYTCFDAIISDYDIYKVETIGDAYMVVSGLPISNGDQHAGEIASMALKLLSAVKQFTIRHRPWDTLKLRIGIHSGPCVAGVVGLTMPRYCLFGDTVNTASRMESTGEELRIHSSHAHKLMLDKLGGYIVQERGLTYVKGKGHMMTWWLVGEQQPRVRRSPCRPESILTTAGGVSTSPLTPHPSPHSPHLSPHLRPQPAPTTPVPHYPTIVIGVPVSTHDPETNNSATQSGSCDTTQSCVGNQVVNPSVSATSDVNNASVTSDVNNASVTSDVNKQRDAEINDILSPDQTDSPRNNIFNSALQDPRTLAGPSSISCRSSSPLAPHKQVRTSLREPHGASIDYNSTSQQNSAFNPSHNPSASPPVNNIYNPVCNQNPVVASIYNSYSPKTAHSPPSSATTTTHNPHLINTTAHNTLLNHNPEITSKRRLHLSNSPRLNSCGSERNSRRSKNYRSSNRNSVYNSVYSSSSSSSSDSIIPYVTTGEQQRILPVNASPSLVEHNCNLFSTSLDYEESVGIEGARGYDIMGRDVPNAHQEELIERPAQLHLDPSTVSYNIKPSLVSGGGLGPGIEGSAGGETGGQGTTQDSITTLPDLRSGISHHYAAYSSSPALSRKQETRENFV